MITRAIEVVALRTRPISLGRLDGADGNRLGGRVDASDALGRHYR